eukprot:15041322-Alexandrium_andersonii.AAC.1
MVKWRVQVKAEPVATVVGVVTADREAKHARRSAPAHTKVAPMTRVRGAVVGAVTVRMMDREP